MRIIGLDLGTDTGVAVYDGSKITASTWKLGTKKEITEWGKTRATRRGDPRVLRFFDSLNQCVVQHRPDVIIFEDVQFATYTFQTQLWSSFRAVVWLVASRAGCVCECVPVATLKKFASGSGAATKEMMAAALFKQFPEFKSQNLNDDAIDAVWLVKWAQNYLGRLVKLNLSP